VPRSFELLQSVMNLKCRGALPAVGVETILARMDTLPDQQLFTSSGTWTKPTDAKWVRIQVQAWRAITVSSFEYFVIWFLSTDDHRRSHNHRGQR